MTVHSIMQGLLLSCLVFINLLYVALITMCRNLVYFQVQGIAPVTGGFTTYFVDNACDFKLVKHDYSFS